MYRNRIKRLPVIIAFAMGIITGTAAQINGYGNYEVYWRTVLVIIVFYMAGLMLKKTIEAVIDEKDEKENESEEKGKNIDLTAKDEIGDFSDHEVDSAEKKDFSGEMENS